MESQHITYARQLLETDPGSKIWYMWVLARSLEQDYKADATKTANIDNRRYEKLLNEARTRIPTHTPEWTNHDVSDPSITLATLFSTLAKFKNQVAPVRRGPIRWIVYRWLCR